MSKQQIVRVTIDKAKGFCARVETPVMVVADEDRADSLMARWNMVARRFATDRVLIYWAAYAAERSN